MTAESDAGIQIAKSPQGSAEQSRAVVRTGCACRLPVAGLLFEKVHTIWLHAHRRPRWLLKVCQPPFLLLVCGSVPMVCNRDRNPLKLFYRRCRAIRHPTFCSFRGVTMGSQNMSEPSAYESAGIACFHGTARMPVAFPCGQCFQTMLASCSTCLAAVTRSE